MTADAIVDLVQLWTPLARKLAMQRGANRHDADDLIQDATEKLLASRGAIPRQPIAYFLRAVINGTYDMVRHRAWERPREEVTL